MAAVEPVTRNFWDYPIGRAHDATDNANGGELGVDLSTPLNSAIRTPTSGIVTYVGSNTSTGGIVKVLTNIPGIGQVYEYFLHLNSSGVKAGQTLQAGQTVGLSGGLQPGAGGWPHVEYGLFTDPKYATQYWGFTSGSTLDPTGLINQLHTSGGVVSGGGGSDIWQMIWQAIQGGMAGTAGLPNQPTAAQALGQSGSSPSPQDALAIQFGESLAKFNYNLPSYLWKAGLIILGGLLIVAGIIVFILPNRREMNTAAQVAGEAA